MQKRGSSQNKNDLLLNEWLSRGKNQVNAQDIKPRAQGVSVPLSLGQQRLLFLNQLYPDNPFYNYADAYRFRGDLNPGRLIESFELVSEKHEILRTNFKIEEGEAVQEIRKLPNLEVFHRDLRNLSESVRLEEARKLAIEEARKLFDLSHGALMRISVFRLGEEDFIVVLTMHHIIFDKWSMGILLRDVAEFYRDLSIGRKAEISPLNIQYADYSLWEAKQELNSPSLVYWESKFKNSKDFLNLPTDFRRPGRPTFRGAYKTKILDANLSKRIRELCAHTSTTPYVFLLTAFKVLLHRYTNETDIHVGSPFTNRDRLELENVIGFFNDTLVLRSDLSDNPTFLELLRQVNKSTREAFAHKHVPFERLVKRLKPDRYLDYNPLFQVMFIYHDAPEIPQFGAGLEVEHEPLDFGVAKFDLTLYVAEKRGVEMSATFEYAQDLFREETIERMHGHFQTLLEGIVQSSSQRISDVQIITRDESVLISEWEDRGGESVTETLFIEHFDERVKACSESTAVSFRSSKLTYGELNERANTVANYLLKLNLDRERPVGLLIETSLEMIIGIIGILKAGLAYLPLDAAYPDERIGFILADSEASLVLTETDLLAKILGNAVEVKTFEQIEKTRDPAQPKLEEAIASDDLAYIIYTSGSTGKPKGVAISHENLAHSTNARFKFYPANPESFLLLSSFSFDSSVAGIFWTLSTGGKLVLTERRAEQDLQALAEIFVKEKITHTLLLPTLYSSLIKSIPANKFESFDVVIVAGEACAPSLSSEHSERLPHVKLYNEYGPTEASVWAIAHELKPEDCGSTVPIGKPISNTQIYILDQNRNRVPIGVPGELYIGGKGVAKGYVNDSELTRERFISNRFSRTASQKLYKTGDICRFRTDGNVEFLGRMDDQAKIRGFRIEPKEIEDVIRSTPGILDVIVKVESRGETPEIEVTETEFANVLDEMEQDEADDMLRSIEKLSEDEIALMIDEAMVK